MSLRLHPAGLRFAALLATLAIATAACSPTSTPSGSAQATAAASAGASAAASAGAGASAEASSATTAKTCRDFGSGPLVTESSGSLVGQAEQVAYKNPFSQECGVEIQTVDAVADVGAQLAAQFAANNITFDVVSGRTLTDIIQYAEKGWLAPIDKSLIKEDPATIAPGGIQEYALGGEIDALVLAYKADKFQGTQPSSWADFFDATTFPGPRMMNNWGNPDASFVQALLAAGVSKENLTPFDYDKAFAELDKIKKDLIVYDSGASMVQHMLNGEAVMCQCTDGRVAQMNRAGGGMAFAYDGAILFANYWAVVKGSPNEELAQHFVASILDPARAATFTSVIGYPTASLEAGKFLPKDVADNLSTAPGNIEKTFMYTQAQTEWIAANFDEITKKWNDWLQGS